MTRRARRVRGWSLTGLTVLTAGVAIAVSGVLARSSPSWAGSATVLAGEGGDFDEPLINALQLSSGGTSAVTPLTSSFFNANVDVARKDFASGLADYAVSEFPLTAAEATTAGQIGRSFAYVPFATSGVAISALIECNPTTTLTPTTLCANLQMSAVVAAQTLSGGGQLWDNSIYSTISGGNPIVPTDPSKDVIPLNQIDPSMNNEAVATYFLDNPAAATVWDAFQTNYKVPSGVPSELWPTDNGLQGIVTVLEQMKPNDPVTDMPETNPQNWLLGTVAPLPFDWLGPPYNMPTVALQNAAGDYVSPSVASLTASVDDATMDPGTNLVTFPANDPNASAYPIPVMTYLIVPTSGLPPAKATALASFIRYVLSPSAQNIMATYDTAPPTQAMINAGLTVAGLVALQEGNSPPSTTTTTTTVAKTSPTTTVPKKTSTTTTTKPPTKKATTTAVTSSGTGSAGTDAATGSSEQSATGSSLALTGGPPWSLPVVGAALLLVGTTTRRLFRRRITRTRDCAP